MNDNGKNRPLRSAPKPPVAGFSMPSSKTVIWCSPDTVSAVWPDVDGIDAVITVVIPGRDHAWDIEIDQSLFGTIRNAMETAERRAEQKRQDAGKMIRAIANDGDGQWWRPSVIARRLGWKYV